MLIKCKACKGAKIVAKMGYTFGACNACGGSGVEEVPDKPLDAHVADLDEREMIKDKALPKALPKTLPKVKHKASNL